MSEQRDDVNERARADWRAETTAFERVHEVVEETHEGQSAAEIGDRALVSEPTARRHLETLVSTGFAETEQDGRTTLYKRDEDRVLMTHIRDLRDRATREELLDSIERMKSDIGEYEREYGAISPEELARSLPGGSEGWDDVSAWRTTRRNLAIAQATLAYDEASDRLAP